MKVGYVFEVQGVVELPEDFDEIHKQLALRNHIKELLEGSHVTYWDEPK